MHNKNIFTGSNINFLSLIMCKVIVTPFPEQTHIALHIIVYYVRYCWSLPGVRTK